MSSTRRNRRQATINSLENLESRELLTNGMKMGPEGVLINKFDYNKLIYKRQNPPPPVSDRRLVFDLRDFGYGPNAKAVITLYGPGTLVSNTSLSPVDNKDAYELVNTHINKKDGHLHIIFQNTTSESQIIGKVYGTKKPVVIDEIRDADVASYNFTGAGTSPMGYVNLAQFDLAHGGRINFTNGVQRIYLNDIGPGSQLALTALPSPPLTSPQNPGGFNSSTTISNSGSSAVTNNSGQRTITTTINGMTVITTLPTTDQITVSNGNLTGVGGITVPGSIPSTSGNTRVEVQGVELYLRNVKGYQEPALATTNTDTANIVSTRIGQEQIGVLLENDDASGTGDRLVFYNVNRSNITWQVQSATASNQSIPIVAQGTGGAVITDSNITLLGSALGQYGNGTFFMESQNRTLNGALQVIAVGYKFNHNGTDQYRINAYSAMNGTLQGWFKVDQPFDGMGGSSGNIFITNSKGGTGTGKTVGYDLTASLDSVYESNITLQNQAVRLNANSSGSFIYPSTFKSMAGTTGAAGISYIYDVGVQYFQPVNPFTSTNPQLGVIKMDVNSLGSISGEGTFQVDTSIPWDPTLKYSMGSLDQDIFIVNPAVSTASGSEIFFTAKMYDADTLKPASPGSFNIYASSGVKLRGISESFYPQVFGAAVIDVKGNLKTFSADNVDNTILNVNGIANYIRSKNTSNTTILAHPVLHLAVGWKPGTNVNIVSSARPTNKTPGGQDRPGTRGGVRVIKNLPIIGPITNPMQQGGF